VKRGPFIGEGDGIVSGSKGVVAAFSPPPKKRKGDRLALAEPPLFNGFSFSLN